MWLGKKRKSIEAYDYQSDGGVKTACEYKGLFVVHIDGDTFFGLVECLCGHLKMEVSVCRVKIIIGAIFTLDTSNTNAFELASWP